MDWKEKLFRDILSQYGLRDYTVLDNVMKCVASKAGQTITASVISTSFKNVLCHGISHNTIGKYLEALLASGVLCKVEREFITTSSKTSNRGSHCYITDMQLFESLCSNNEFIGVHEENANEVYNLAAARTKLFNKLRELGLEISGGRVEYSIRSKKVGSKRVGQNIDFIVRHNEINMHFIFMNLKQRTALRDELDGYDEFLRAIKSVGDDAVSYVVDIDKNMMSYDVNGVTVIGFNAAMKLFEGKSKKI